MPLMVLRTRFSFSYSFCLKITLDLRKFLWEAIKNFLYNIFNAQLQPKWSKRLILSSEPSLYSSLSLGLSVYSNFGKFTNKKSYFKNVFPFWSFPNRAYVICYLIRRFWHPRSKDHIHCLLHAPSIVIWFVNFWQSFVSSNYWPLVSISIYSSFST